MSLITRETAALRGGGWKVTPMGRVVWNVKMRPERPLPPPSVPLTGKAEKGKIGKKRKRVREPDTRARRRRIDMTRWGSTYLSGVWLDGGVSIGRTSGEEGIGAQEGDEWESGSGGESESVHEIEVEEAEVEEEGEPLGNKDVVMADDTPTPQAPAAVTPPTTVPVSKLVQSQVTVTDVAAEKLASLSLLASMFGDKHGEDDDWVGRESAGSDIDEEELLRGDLHQTGEATGVDFEEVPKEGRQKTTIVDAPTSEPLSQQPTNTKKYQNVPSTGLKDLFVPREEDGKSS
jgi:hypothetical protein